MALSHRALALQRALSSLCTQAQLLAGPQAAGQAARQAAWAWVAAVAAAAAPPSRRLHTAAAAAARGRTEDFDLIAPDVGLARIDGIGETGFSVNNVQVEGAVMLSGDIFTLWRVQRWSDVTLESLSLLRLLRPVPDLLVLGTGRTPRQLPPELARQLHDMGVRVDATSTINAMATFNVLNQESRAVVGALLPQNAED